MTSQSFERRCISISAVLFALLTLASCATPPPKDSSENQSPPPPVTYSEPAPIDSSACEFLSLDAPRKLSDLDPNNRVRGYVCLKVAIGPETQGVVTLTNISKSGDWNLLIGERFDPDSLQMSGVVEYQNNSLSSSELVWLPRSPPVLTVIAYPVIKTPSVACISYHHFNTGSLLLMSAALATAQVVLADGLTPDNSSQEYKDNVNRVVAGGLSAAQGNKVAAVGYDLVLNEISLQLSNLFGTGSWFFTFGTNYYGGYLKESVKYLLTPNGGCTTSE